MPQPITPEAYAALRAAIDAGTTAVQTWAKRRKGGCEEYCMPQTDPDLGTLSDLIYTYIPMDMIGIAPAQAMIKDMPQLPGYYVPEDTPDDRYGWATFADREQLVEALEKVTPAEVRAQLGDLEVPPSPGAAAGGGWTGAATDGISWWAVALAAGGVLAWIGRRHIAGFVVAVGAEKLFRALFKGGASLALGYAALQLLDAVTTASTKTVSIVPYVIGGVVVTALVVAVIVVVKTNSSKTSRRLAAA